MTRNWDRPEPPARNVITPGTIGRFLIGERRAIEEVADSRAVLFLAFLFIVAAGLARNYDHHLLLEEPLWIGGPVMMSLFSSFFIFSVVKIFGRVEAGGRHFGNFLAFFRCFVLTAPLAWLYGIPVEQFMAPPAATQFNFGVLVLVSLWRLILMARVLQVLFHFFPARAFALIALPASAEMFFATLVRQVDIVGIMGGMRLTESDQFLLTATNIMTLGTIWLCFASLLIGLFSDRGPVEAWQPAPEQSRVAPASWLTAVLVLLLWGFVAWKPQGQLQNRATLRKLIRSGDFPAALAFVEDKSPSDFPRHQYLLDRSDRRWVPPLALKALVYRDDWPEWVEEAFYEDLREILAQAEKNDEDPVQVRSFFYKDFLEAPFVEEVAKRITPGYRPTDQRSEDAPFPSALPPTVAP